MAKFTKKSGEENVRTICQLWNEAGLKYLYTESGVGGIKVRLGKIDSWLYTDLLTYVRNNFEKEFEYDESASRWFLVHGGNIIRQYFEFGVCHYGHEGYTLSIGPLGNPNDEFVPYDREKTSVELTEFAGLNIYKVNL